MTLSNIHTDDRGDIHLPLVLSQEEFVNLKAAILDISMMTINASEANCAQTQSAYFIGSLFRDLYDWEVGKAVKKAQKRSLKLHPRPQ